VFRGAYRLDLSALELPAGEPETERARVRIAFEKAHNDLARVQTAAAREIDEAHALIFASHLLLLTDPMLRGRIDDEIARGLSAPLADRRGPRRVRGAAAARAKPLQARAQRRRRRSPHSAARPPTRRRVTRPLGARIVLTSRIPPSLVVELKTEGAIALVTETGGATSHGVLLARAMGIPTVTGITHMLPSVHPRDRVVVDGTTGVVVVRPTDVTIARYEEERRRVDHARTEHARLRDVPFIVRDAFPTLREQIGIYRRPYELFPDGPITFRILEPRWRQVRGRRNHRDGTRRIPRVSRDSRSPRSSRRAARSGRGARPR
jgi:phosphoenolpyruvate-protein kinase (PTS system EI component)